MRLTITSARASAICLVSLYCALTLSLVAPVPGAAADGLSGQSLGAPIVEAVSPEDLRHSVTQLGTGSYLIRNEDSRPGSVLLSARHWRRPVVMELGAQDRHYRRVRTSATGSRITVGLLPSTSYEVLDADDLFRAACPASSPSLSLRQQIALLGRQLASLDSRVGHERAESLAARKRLTNDAYSALLGIEFDVSMTWRANYPADFRMFAGREFTAVCTVRNQSAETIRAVSIKLLAPDEWSCRCSAGFRQSFATLGPGESRSVQFVLRAPSRSALRPDVFPVIGELTFAHEGNRVVSHYPCRVALTDPFTVSQTLVAATPDRLDADVSIESAFPGLRMKDVSVYYFLSQGLVVHPPSQKLSFTGRKTFRVSYVKDGNEARTFRGVSLGLRGDEHTVRFRTVAEATLDLGTRTRSAALWVVERDDARTEMAVIQGRECRRAVPVASEAPRYIYLQASPNFPRSGKTFVTVTYFDEQQGAFALEYDMCNGEGSGHKYVPLGEPISLSGTGSWVRRTFVLGPATAPATAAALPGLRIAILAGNVAFSQISASKFPVTGGT